MKTSFYVFTLLTLSFFISCQNSKNVRELSPILIESEIKSINDIVSNIEHDLEISSKAYKDSLLLSLDLNAIPEIYDSTSREMFTIFLTAIKERDTAELYSWSFDGAPNSRYRDLNLMYIDPINYAPYALYMADSVKYIPAYLDVFTSFGRLNYCYLNIIDDIDEEWIHLSGISKQQRDLAILYLIKSYRSGYTQSALALSLYFRFGIYYFPKDLLKADILDYIWDKPQYFRKVF